MLAEMASQVVVLKGMDCLTGLGLTYSQLPVWTGPAVLDYTQAVELDAQFFFGGTPWDMVARNYSAVALNIANNSTLTQADVVGKVSHVLTPSHLKHAEGS